MRKGFIIALVVVTAGFIFFMITREEVFVPIVAPLDREQLKETIEKEILAFPPVEEIEYEGKGFTGWKNDLLTSPSSLRRSEAARALRAFGPAAVPVLIERVEKDEDFWIRKWSVVSLGDIGPMAKDAVPVLIKTLEGHEQALVRQAAATSLGEIGPIAADAVPTLIKALEDEWSVRLAAAEALGKMGPLARDAIPALTRLLNDESTLVRLSAGVSLRKIRR